MLGAGCIQLSYLSNSAVVGIDLNWSYFGKIILSPRGKKAEFTATSCAGNSNLSPRLCCYSLEGLGALQRHLLPPVPSHHSRVYLQPVHHSTSNSGLGTPQGLGCSFLLQTLHHWFSQHCFQRALRIILRSQTAYCVTNVQRQLGSPARRNTANKWTKPSKPSVPMCL